MPRASFAWCGTVSALVLCAASCRAEEQLVTVETVGIGAIVDGDERRAEDEALVDAQRQAVEQGMGVLVVSETEIVNFQLLYDRVHTKAAGYLARYEVLDKEREEDQLRVRIRAAVRLEPVVADMLEVETLMRRLSRPRLMVVFEEVDRGRRAGGHIAAIEAQQALLDKGLELVDGTQIVRIYQPEVLGKALEGDPGPLLQLATDEGVEVVVVGRVESRLLQTPVAGMQSGGASIEARALNTQTGRVLAVRSLELGATGGRPGVAAVDADGACQGAMRKAARELFLGAGAEDRNAFVAKVLAAWVRSPTVLRLSLARVPFARRRTVVEALRSLRLVEEVLQREYENEQLLLELRGRAGLEAILEAVDGLQVEGQSIVITGLKGSVATAELR